MIGLHSHCFQCSALVCICCFVSFEMEIGCLLPPHLAAELGEGIDSFLIKLFDMVMAFYMNFPRSHSHHTQTFSLQLAMLYSKSLVN